MANIKGFLLIFIIVNSVFDLCSAETTASDLFLDIYKTCLSDFTTSCIKPKTLSWMSKSIHKDEIKITSDLSIIKTGEDEPVKFSQKRSNDDIKFIQILDKIDSFLSTHSIKLNAPTILQTEEARSLIPKSYFDGGLAKGFQVPLTDGNAVEGRGFVKKVMIPFLLGLKFKTTVLVPITLALIALKTWKAMTLGLLSLVLSGALVIFKIAKPKVVNYEVVHYPHHHVEHHVDHVIPHHIEHIPHHIEHIPHHIDHIPHHIDHIPHHIEHIPHHIDHIPHHIDHIPHHIEHIEHPSSSWEPHGWARSANVPEDAQEIAYAGQIPK